MKTPIDLADAIETTMRDRFEIAEENDLETREEDLVRAVVDFDDEPDALTALDYVLGVLLDARDLIIEKNGGADGSRLVLPKFPIKTLAQLMSGV